ncbi:RICIN domain-containing protein [Streptomyces bambusae]|uniref:RICIN domain-containing protein n=1 Tax=Streptomyces bambusae TaxID=1550616 RepID=UPI001CFFCFC2|nr:RICIN domain-containing protein [Streptomyces bambusae]MCB5170428.1 RICIN domain-containing protein [Streptomyces bambusae]
MSVATRPRTGLRTALPLLAGALTAALLTATPTQAVTGPEALSGTHSYTATLTVGGEADSRGCSATLLNPWWLVTATSCLVDVPGSAASRGRPARATTATLGTGQTVQVAELVPRADRDLALVRLTAPAQGVAPARFAGAAAVPGGDLTAVGLGRTATEWVPGKAHTASFSTTSVTPTTLNLAGQGKALCKGDAGGPVLNPAGEVVAVASRSWQGGCLGADPAETRTGAIASRIDDLGQWLTATAAHGPYLVYNTVTGKCADIPDTGPGRIDGPVSQYTCIGGAADNQLFQWDYRGAGAGGSSEYTIRSPKDGLCLDVPDYGAVAAGAKVSQYTCVGTSADNQLFTLTPRPDGTFWIVNVKSGLCLDVDGIRTGGNDARLTLYHCSDQDDHNWKLL